MGFTDEHPVRYPGLPGKADSTVKRDGFDHPKTRRLKRELGVPHYAAVGLLECLFHVTAKYAPDGGVGRLGDDEIADYLGWEEDAGALVVAFQKCGWLDPCDTHRLRVHDWSDHADDAVKKRLARMGASGHVRTTAGHGSPARALPEPEPSQCQAPPEVLAAVAAASDPADPLTDAVWAAWERWTARPPHRTSSADDRSLRTLQAEYGPEMVAAACNEAHRCAAKATRPVPYIRSICERCKDQGVMPGERADNKPVQPKAVAVARDQGS